MTTLDFIFCAPINIDAFVLNTKVCDEGSTKIAPITQPDYRGLRLNSLEIQPDILPNVDLSRTQPSAVNSRVSVVEAQSSTQLDPTTTTQDTPITSPTRDNRIGVYVHWSLPRLYRAATGGAAVTNDLPTKENIRGTPRFVQYQIDG